MILYLICDISGSMSENSKYLIVRNLVRSVEQYYRLGYGTCELKLISWNNEARIIEWNQNDEFPPEMLESKDTINTESLIKFLDGQPDGKILLISDGFLTDAFKKWKNKLPVDTMRIIKVGADTDIMLKGKDIFLAEDLFAALDSWGASPSGDIA